MERLLTKLPNLRGGGGVETSKENWSEIYRGAGLGQGAGPRSRTKLPLIRVSVTTTLIELHLHKLISQRFLSHTE